MDSIESVMQRMHSNGNAPAMVWSGREYSYEQFTQMIDGWSERLHERGVAAGTVCGIVGDYSPQVCALFFALMRARAILVPLTREIEAEIPGFLKIAGVRFLYRFESDDSSICTELQPEAENPLILTFRERSTPGLIVFTSGSTGKPKAILHDCERVMRKFVRPREARRTVLFLMMDHFGGFNTLLSTFAYGGVGLCLVQRTAESVCRAIEEARGQLLPTTPTFLNLLIAGGTYRSFDLSSVKLITYGTEVMSAATLARVRQVFPNAQIKQTYGLSELGVLRSKSESDESLWVKVGGDGFEVKVVDNVLWVRSEANMVGYLNAPNPFDEEGWMCTGDEVEVKGEYMRFLGRKSDVINVGGQKVFPVEVETVLLSAENVREAAVYGMRHPLMGNLVHAKISLDHPEDLQMLTERLRKVCLAQLAKFKIPVKFNVVSDDTQHGVRFKKRRDGGLSADEITESQ